MAPMSTVASLGPSHSTFRVVLGCCDTNWTSIAETEWARMAATASHSIFVSGAYNQKNKTCCCSLSYAKSSATGTLMDEILSRKKCPVLEYNANTSCAKMTWWQRQRRRKMTTRTGDVELLEFIISNGAYRAPPCIHAGQSIVLTILSSNCSYTSYLLAPIAYSSIVALASLPVVRPLWLTCAWVFRPNLLGSSSTSRVRSASSIRAWNCLIPSWRGCIARATRISFDASASVFPRHLPPWRLAFNFRWEKRCRSNWLHLRHLGYRHRAYWGQIPHDWSVIDLGLLVEVSFGFCIALRSSYFGRCVFVLIFARSRSWFLFHFIGFNLACRGLSLGNHEWPRALGRVALHSLGGRSTRPAEARHSASCAESLPWNYSHVSNKPGRRVHMAKEKRGSLLLAYVIRHTSFSFCLVLSFDFSDGAPSSFSLFVVIFISIFLLLQQSHFFLFFLFFLFFFFFVFFFFFDFFIVFVFFCRWLKLFSSAKPTSCPCTRLLAS